MMHQDSNREETFLSSVGRLLRRAKRAWDLAEPQADFRRRKTEERGALLDPNKGSSVKVERYDFSLNQSLTIGTAQGVDMTLQPSVTMRPVKLICNVPCQGFVSFLTIQVANVAITIGNATDAFTYTHNATGQIDCPTICPANRVILTGTYSGRCPSGRPVKIAARVQEEYERLMRADEARRIGSTKGRTKKVRPGARQTVPPPQRVDFSFLDSLGTEGPYPVGSNFLLCATFQGPAIFGV